MTGRRRAIAVALTCLLTACSSRSKNENENENQNEKSSLLEGRALSLVTELELREELKDFSDRFSNAIQATANEIVALCGDNRIRRRTVYWNLLTIPLCKETVFQQAPLAALIDLWVFCQQQEQFLVDGDGRESFGEWTRLAVEAAGQLTTDIQSIAEACIPEPHYTEAREAVDAFVLENPIRGSFARRSARPAMVRASDAKSLQWIRGLPLAPFRAFMGDTAQSVQEFTIVAEGFVALFRTLPSVIRWEAELLVYDLEDRSTTTEVIASFKKISESAESFARTTEKLPAELRREITAVLDGVDAKQAGLRETLSEAQKTLDRVDETIASSKPLLDSVERSTANWQVAGEKWGRAITAFHDVTKVFQGESRETGQPGASVSDGVVKAVHAPSGDDEDSGFDINDYTRTAERAEAAAVEFRALTADLKTLIDEEAIAPTVATIAWYTVLVIVVFFVSLLGYRIASSRLAGRPSADGQRGANQIAKN